MVLLLQVKNEVEQAHQKAPLERVSGERQLYQIGYRRANAFGITELRIGRGNFAWH